MSLINRTSLYLFLLSVVLRTLNYWITRTYFIPDEFYQVWEVSSRLSFGVGYLSWEYVLKLRSMFLPYFISTLWNFLNFCNLKDRQIYFFVPSFLVILLGSISDVYLVKLYKKVTGDRTVWLIYSIWLTNWFLLLTMSRIVINTLELHLSIVALYYFPIANLKLTNRWSLEISLVLASCTCMLRPTNGILWLVMGLFLIKDSYYKTSELKLTRILVSTSCIATVAMSLLVYLDSQLYGEWTFVPYNFVYYNLYLNLSQFYGTAPFYYYFTVGLGTLLTVYTPLFFYGFVQRGSPSLRQLKHLSILVTLVYSCLAHKEVRFILPILPILLMVTTIGINQLKLSNKVVAGMMGLNLAIGMVGNLYYQPGVIKVMYQLQTQLEQDTRLKSVGFLMPCHSTPFYSHLAQPINLWFLTCTPNYQSLPNYQDTTDRFYSDPIQFLDSMQRVQPTSTNPNYYSADASLDFQYFWPDRLVLFETLLADAPVQAKIMGMGYQVCFSTFNSVWIDDLRRRGNVLILCKK